MIETTHFINLGYGWVCKHCMAARQSKAAETEPPSARARFMQEGEAEETEPELSTWPLARWRDATRQVLVCPRCSIEEPINKA